MAKEFKYGALLAQAGSQMLFANDLKHLKNHVVESVPFTQSKYSKVFCYEIRGTVKNLMIKISYFFNDSRIDVNLYSDSNYLPRRSVY